MVCFPLARLRRIARGFGRPSRLEWTLLAVQSASDFASEGLQSWFPDEPLLTGTFATATGILRRLFFAEGVNWTFERR